MLTTDKRKAAMRNINVRIQKHGKERVRAMDLKFTFQIRSDELDGISPGLLEMLYRQPTREGDQLQIDADATGFTVLRNPGLEPIKLKGKFPGYELTVADSSAEETGNSLFLIDATLQGITIDACDGGIANITVTASLPFDSDEIADASEFLVEEDVLLTLTPPQSEPVRLETGTIEDRPEAVH